MKAILIDTETTGLEDGRLIQVAYKRLDTFDVVNELFKPEKAIEIQAMAIHHITEEEIADKPAFKGSKIQKELIELSSTHIFIAHNAKFDVGILNSDGVDPKFSICTKKVAYEYYKDEPSYSLQCLRYSRELDDEDLRNLMPHDALTDIILLEKLFFDLFLGVEAEIKNSDEKVILTKMINITTNPQTIRKFAFGKYRGKSISDVLEKDINYLQWMVRQNDLDDDLKFTLETHLKQKTLKP